MSAACSVLNNTRPVFAGVSRRPASLKRSASSHCSSCTCAAARFLAHSAASAVQAGLFGNRQCLRQIRDAAGEILHQQVGAAQFAKRLLVWAGGPALLVQRDGALLHLERALELSQPRVTGAGVVERHAVDGRLFEIVEREDAREPRERLVDPPLVHEPHPEIVEGEHQAVPVAVAARLRRATALSRVSASFQRPSRSSAWPASTPASRRTVSARARVCAMRVQGRERLFELSSRHLEPRANVLMPRAHDANSG